MRNVTIGLVKKTDWETIKNLHHQYDLPLDYIEHKEYYSVFVVWNTTKFTTNIFKPGFREIIGNKTSAEYNDFITNYKPKIDASPPDTNPVNIAGVGRMGKKLMIHESSRPDNLNKTYTTCWTGSGDDIQNHIMWGGEPLAFSLSSSDTSVYKDVYFDPVFGETWLHEGYGLWENAGMGDYFNVSVYAKGVSLQTSQNLDLLLDADNRVRYSPSGPGTGTHGFASTPAPVINHEGTGWWDLDENNNLVPNFEGTGKYDIYTVDKEAGRLLNRILVYGTSTSYTMLQSADSVKIVYPYFIRIEVFNISGTNWKMFFFMTVYRERTI